MNTNSNFKGGTNNGGRSDLNIRIHRDITDEMWFGVG